MVLCAVGLVCTALKGGSIPASALCCLGLFPKFSCQLCIFHEERAVRLSCGRKHRAFGMGWLHLQSVGMNVFAGGKLEPVAARPLFWRVCKKSASNLPSFTYVNTHFLQRFFTLPFSSVFLVALFILFVF